MDSGLLTTLAGAITGGAALGGVIGGLFGYRQKTRVALLENMNSDYDKRVRQLEADRDRLDKADQEKAKRIEQLEAEKTLPLQNLIELVTSQHTATLAAITALTEALTNRIAGDKK